jgi:hypothetical protein
MVLLKERRMVWTLNDWEAAWDASGKTITCAGLKDSSSGPFLEFRIDGTLSGYHVHLKSAAGAQITTIRYKSDLSDHGSGRNIIGRSQHDSKCNFQTVIRHLEQERYFTSADMVRRLKAAYDRWSGGTA